MSYILWPPLPLLRDWFTLQPTLDPTTSNHVILSAMPRVGQSIHARSVLTHHINTENFVEC